MENEHFLVKNNESFYSIPWCVRWMEHTQEAHVLSMLNIQLTIESNLAVSFSKRWRYSYQVWDLNWKSIRSSLECETLTLVVRTYILPVKSIQLRRKSIQRGFMIMETIEQTRADFNILRTVQAWYSKNVVRIGSAIGCLKRSISMNSQVFILILLCRIF